MAFSLPSLPYDYASLEPYIDATTMNIHHTKHHQTYINNLNGAMEKVQGMQGTSLEDIVQDVIALPDDVKTVVRNNAGGHWNHCFFWKCMISPSETSGPSGELKEAIERSFGSVEEMKSKFNAAAAGRFGSGWAWLGCKEDGSLIITSTPNQDNPMMKGLVEDSCKPVLGLDVWEHAYYLKYQNRRPEYIANFWNVVHWEYLSENYRQATSGGMAKI